MGILLPLPYRGNRRWFGNGSMCQYVREHQNLFDYCINPYEIYDKHVIIPKLIEEYKELTKKLNKPEWFLILLYGKIDIYQMLEEKRDYIEEEIRNLYKKYGITIEINSEGDMP